MHTRLVLFRIVFSLLCISSLLCLDAKAGLVGGSGDYLLSMLVNGQNRIETGAVNAILDGTYESTVAIPEGVQIDVLGDLLILANGDPFIDYELTLTNRDVAAADVFLGITIDMQSTLAGLPVISTLSGEIQDPGGEGVNTNVLHRGFVQSAFQPSLLVGLDAISSSIDTAGSFSFRVDSTVPESLHVNDSFNRLRVVSQFVIPPGDTYKLHGNTTIIAIPEPSSFVFFAVSLCFVAARWPKKTIADTEMYGAPLRLPGRRAGRVSTS